MTTITPRLEAYLKIKGSIAERMNEILEVIGKIQGNPTAKDIIKRRINYCKYKLRLLTKYAI